MLEHAEMLNAPASFAAARQRPGRQGQQHQQKRRIKQHSADARRPRSSSNPKTICALHQGIAETVSPPLLRQNSGPPAGGCAAA
jgi:hypothetical protein